MLNVADLIRKYFLQALCEVEEIKVSLLQGKNEKQLTKTLGPGMVRARPPVGGQRRHLSQGWGCGGSGGRGTREVNCPPNASVVLCEPHKGLRLCAKLGRHQHNEGGRGTKSLPGEPCAPEETSFSNSFDALQLLTRQSVKKGPPHAEGHLFAQIRKWPLCRHPSVEVMVQLQGPWLGGQGCSSEGTFPRSFQTHPCGSGERFNRKLPVFSTSMWTSFRPVLCFGRGLERTKRGHWRGAILPRAAWVWSREVRRDCREWKSGGYAAYGACRDWTEEAHVLASIWKDEKIQPMKRSDWGWPWTTIDNGPEQGLGRSQLWAGGASTSKSACLYFLFCVYFPFTVSNIQSSFPKVPPYFSLTEQ